MGEKLPSLSRIEQIEELAKYDARHINGEHHMYLYLCRWWSQYYKRPFKDPILQQYTFEELLYEYYSVIEHQKAQQERNEEESDRIEEERWDEAENWADQMEAEERAELQKQKQAKGKKPDEPADPTKDPENIKWMEEELAKDRERFGDSFGEDLNLDFESDD